ncbi:MAG: recombinase family protein, partial [Kiritimatiellae bacterium]|nr:recombinase family protein [Kiritimatiellia bacterium]
EKMKKLGVGFTSVSEPFVDTSSPMGELVVNLLVSFGQWERKTIQERIQRHFRTALEQGYFVGGVPPYGYKVENQSLVPDPETAKNVPHIFRLFLQHESLKKVAAQLSTEGIERFPGRPWTIQSVKNCLRNVRYVGDANSHGKIVKGRQPPLITRDLWEKVSGKLKETASNPLIRVACPETALFQGLVICGHCKKPMTYRWSKKDTLGVRKYSYFVCQQDMRKGISTCPIRHVSVTTVQDAVEQELESVMLASTAMLVSAANATTFTPEQIVSGLRRHIFWQGLSMTDRRIIYRLFIRSITVFKSSLELRMNLPIPGAAEELKKTHYIPKETPPDGDVRIEEEECLFVKVPVAFRTISGRKHIIKDGGGAAPAKPTQHQLNTIMAQGAVLKAFAKAIAWMKLIDEGKATSISQLSEIVGVDRHFVLHTLRLATLSPRIIRAALSGELPDGFSLQKVRKIDTDDW